MMISKIEAAFKERLDANQWLDDTTVHACDAKVLRKLCTDKCILLVISLRLMQLPKWWLTLIIFITQPNCFPFTIQLVFF